MSSAICFNLYESKILSSGNGVKLFQIMQAYNNPWGKKLKALWGKKKMLVLAISSCPTMFCTLSQTTSVYYLTLYQKNPAFNDAEKEGFENIVGKEKMVITAFSLFSVMFSTLSETQIIISLSSFMSSASEFNVD